MTDEAQRQSLYKERGDAGSLLVEDPYSATRSRAKVGRPDHSTLDAIVAFIDIIVHIQCTTEQYTSQTSALGQVQ